MYEIFQKSRKMVRSPIKKEREEGQEGLKEIIKKIMEETRRM